MHYVVGFYFAQGQVMLIQKDRPVWQKGKWNGVGGKIDDVPSAIFKNHVSIAPFDDDDFRGIVDLLGADRVLLGSDYPHPEGYPVPVSMLDEIELTDTELALITHDNAAKLLRLD